MSKLLTLKEVIEMNSDEFNRNFLIEQEGTSVKDLIGHYLQGKIAREVFKDVFINTIDTS